MKCPYCMGNVEDGALVCIHCDHDLFFLRPLLERLAAVETRLAAVEEALARRPDPAPGSTITSPPVDAGFRWRYLGVVLLAGVLGAAAFLVFKRHGGWRPFLWASILVPVPAGLSIGLWWTGRHLLQYLGMGALVGSINFAVVVSMDPSLASGWGEGALVYVVGGAVLFTTGGAFGDWLQQRRTPHPFVRDFASQLAMRIVPAVTTATPAVREARVRLLAQFIGAVAPVLTTAGAIFTAWLSARTKGGTVP